MKRLLRDTAGKSGFEYLLTVATIGALGAVPFWAFGSGMDSTITGTTNASALPAMGGQAMAHTADQVEGMCYVQTYASNAKSSAEQHGADVRVGGLEDVYVTQNENGYWVSRIRVACDQAGNVMNQYLGMGLSSDAYVGYLPKTDDALFGGDSQLAPAPENNSEPDNSEPDNSEPDNSEPVSQPQDETSEPEADTSPSSENVGSNAQAGEGLAPRDVANNPMQLALNEIRDLSDEELESLLAQEGTTPAMETLMNSYYSAIPEECFGEQGLTEACANNEEVLAILEGADSLYYTLLSEAAHELTYREFGSLSEAQLTQKIEDFQMILDECTALSPAPAYTQEGYPAVNESCQNESGEQFYQEYANAVGQATDEQSFYEAEAAFAQTEIAAQCWAVQDQPTYDESGKMVPTEACAASEAKMNAYMEAQLDSEAVMYTLERQNFENLFGPDAYEGAHSLQLLEYDENGQLVRSERLYTQAEALGLVEPGAFEDAVAADQAQLDELEGGAQVEETDADDGDGGGGLFGFISKAANWVGDKIPLNEAYDWIADIGGDMPVIDQVTNVLGGALRLSNVINPVAWALEPADTFNFAKNMTIGIGKEFWDMGTGLAFGLIGDVGYNWLWKEGVMGGLGLFDGGQFWKSAANFAVKTPGALWNMGKNILGTAYTGLDGSKSIDEQAQAFGRTAAFAGTVWVGGSSAAAKLGVANRFSSVASRNAAYLATADDVARAGGYANRAAALQNRLIARGAPQEAIEAAGRLRSSFQSRIDLASKAEFAAAEASKASTWIGRTRLGGRVGERAAGPLNNLYNGPFGAPGRAWSRFADGLQGTSNRALRATGTPQTFGALRNGAQRWAAAPQWGIPFRHPYAMAAGGAVYRSGARSDNADYYIGAAKDMVKAMSEGMMPGGGGGIAGAAGAAAGQ